ncbi:hypothetical protein GCM10017557_79470 [Streptomyces aurantiacus]|uniref:Uncharacterized protein n=1 Tax=Streptomyces aurantiacus TaxID=47760 RepID=A0A7G1PCD4_9ACTN|nr:hypothetical protein GCM10017557_79470 [Streptomyces aurantiacus]
MSAAAVLPAASVLLVLLVILVVLTRRAVRGALPRAATGERCGTNVSAIAAAEPDLVVPTPERVRFPAPCGHILVS